MPRDAIKRAEDDRALPLQDGAELRTALADANIQTLLMVYVHLTHDEAVLEQFAPHIHPVFSGRPSDIPDGLAAELREKLLHVLTTPGAAVAEPLPPTLMQRMMSVGVGEPVDDEYLPLLREQMGFEIPEPRLAQPGRAVPSERFRVLVIGAGLTGLAAGIKLREAGYDHVIIEKNPEVGGTWYENTYPGVGVDTPSHFYSYSFAINPDWTTYHPKGHEMQDYLLRVADRYDLRRNIRFETRVVACRFDEAEQLWNVTVRDKAGVETVIAANAVINAHGPLNRWSWPKIDGLEDFLGQKLHTAAWDASIDLKGKKVGVIGTGASASQLVPAIAPEVGDLTVFMRSKHWVIYNPEITSVVTEGKRWALRHIPHYREWFRFRVYWAAADGLFVNVLKDPEWPADSPSVSAHNEAMRQYCLGHLHATFADRPDLIEKLTPDFPVFSKRIVLDAGWFDALKRDNVQLETGAIDRILPDGVRMADGTVHKLDVLIMATGFDVANMVGSLEIIGRGGRNLGQEWGADDPRAYLGITVPGYPNLFLTVGPNSAPNHAAGQNLISETQIHYIIECLDLITASGARAIEPTHEAFIGWNDMIDRRMPEMIWTHPKAKSYYNNSKGRPFLSWPFRLVDYWNQTRKPIPDHFSLT
ncbi:NAD(P)/FAD-dependent oxidoreductase [Azospirillum sp. 412522]|nr:NAD(P)/FAD-dependent oxidoreductase [Azospirillum sp. 412522]MBY6262040.1 NAD(P)/FAD-dependent oxidoreductase [Azospirillum sp. 412522]